MALVFGKDTIGQHTGEAGLLEYNFKKVMKNQGMDTAFFDTHEIDSALTYRENWDALEKRYGVKSESRFYAEMKAQEQKYNYEQKEREAKRLEGIQPTLTAKQKALYEGAKEKGEAEEKRVVKILEKEGHEHKVSPALRRKYHVKLKPKKSLAHEKRAALREMLAPHPARRKVKKVYSHKHGKGWHRQIVRHATAAEKGWRRHPMRRQTKYLRTVGRKRTWSHVDLSRDRRIKAKTVRKPWQPTWRGDVRGRRV